MINFENVLSILKKEYFKINREILRFDFLYNNFHIFFFYKPTLIKNGKDMFVFNADINNVIISKPLYFHNDVFLITSIPREIFRYFLEISSKPSSFFEDVKEKILNNKVNYAPSNIQEVKISYNSFINNFPEFKTDKPYFWRLTTAKMSDLMEEKLRNNYKLNSQQIQFLKDNNKTAQFTHNPAKERILIINLKNN